MIKQSFDFLLAFSGLIIFSPFLFFIGFLIKMDQPRNSIIFVQTRIGRGGLPFIIYKFRTMVTNHDGNTISIAGENRVTSVGIMLRKYKLDELPALLNVLKGDMSFVGPRPDVPGYADKLVGEDRKVLELRPGITGLASLKYSNEEELLAKVEDPVKFNNEVIYPDKVKINLKYYYNHSFWGDIEIIFRTIFRKYNDDKI